MIFRELLNKETADLQPEFDKLINAAFKNQTHPGDLLLIHVNGFYDEEAHKRDNQGEKLSPYLIGPNSEGHSESLHHEFIGEHLKKEIKDQDYEEYKALHQWSSERAEEIEALTKAEVHSIQHEMLIYLKIWEKDLFIKKLYQFTRLASARRCKPVLVSFSRQDQNGSWQETAIAVPPRFVWAPLDNPNDPLMDIFDQRRFDCVVLHKDKNVIEPRVDRPFHEMDWNIRPNQTIRYKIQIEGQNYRSQQVSFQVSWNGNWPADDPPAVTIQAIV